MTIHYRYWHLTIADRETLKEHTKNLSSLTDNLKEFWKNSTITHSTKINFKELTHKEAFSSYERKLTATKEGLSKYETSFNNIKIGIELILPSRTLYTNSLNTIKF